MSASPPVAAAEEARFELLGVLLCADAYVRDRFVVETLAHYVLTPEAHSSNGIIDRRIGSHLMSIRADVRSGAHTHPPRVVVSNLDLPDSIVTTLPGRPLHCILGGWLAHPGLVIADASVTPGRDGRGSTLKLDIEPTHHTFQQAVRAVVATAHLRDQRRHLRNRNTSS